MRIEFSQLSVTCSGKTGKRGVARRSGTTSRGSGLPRSDRRGVHRSAAQRGVQLEGPGGDDACRCGCGAHSHRPLRSSARAWPCGQGAVWLARDTRLDRLVALKVLSRSAMGAGREIERLRREAALVARLDHPGICVVHEAGVEQGTPYIAMQYISGRPLSALIEEREGRAGLSSVKSWVTQLKSGEESGRGEPSPFASRGQSSSTPPSTSSASF